MSLSRTAIAILCGAAAFAQQSVEVVEVESRPVERTVRLPGEFLPYQSVEVYARVSGFLDSVKVDRGSVVKEGDILATLSAPEMTAQIAEAESKTRALEARQAEAVARAAAAGSTYERFKAASATPGVVAQNELVQAEEARDAALAAVRAAERSVEAARAAVSALRQLEQYLTVKAPFEGVVTERVLHPGALAGPGSGPKPILRLEQVSRLRLVVAVPEAEVSGIVRGARARFTVPAYPGIPFAAVVARLPRSMDAATRTMPVELDVDNGGGRLAPGMYPEVEWPVRAGRRSLLVPASSIATTTERSFVIRVREGRAEWVDVRRGVTAGERVEVFGPLQPGDRIVRQASDEIRNGSPVAARLKNKA